MFSRLQDSSDEMEGYNPCKDKRDNNPCYINLRHMYSSQTGQLGRGPCPNDRATSDKMQTKTGVFAWAEYGIAYWFELLAQGVSRILRPAEPRHITKKGAIRIKEKEHGSGS